MLKDEKKENQKKPFKQKKNVNKTKKKYIALSRTIMKKNIIKT